MKQESDRKMMRVALILTRCETVHHIDIEDRPLSWWAAKLDCHEHTVRRAWAFCEEVKGGAQYFSLVQAYQNEED